jgi:hypothetical protein
MSWYTLTFGFGPGLAATLFVCLAVRIRQATTFTSILCTDIIWTNSNGGVADTDKVNSVTFQPHRW